MNAIRASVLQVFHWLDDRIGLSALVPLARKKKVPIHKHTFWYYMGGMLVFLFMLQIATGILLLFYYRPSSEGAYESVRFIMSEVQFGWLIRSVHSWAANLMVFVAFVHMFSVLLLKAYRPPRELTWMTGVVLLGLCMGLGFTGYLLPWNELAFFATRVGTEIPGVFPVIGPFTTEFLRGGEDVSGATLTRFFAFHVSILPALLFMTMSLHVLLVQRHGMSIPPSIERSGKPVRSIRFVPNFLLRDAIGWLSALAILAAVAAFIPAHLGEKADPFAPAPAGIRPEWYFMFMFQALKMLPAEILGISGELIGVAFFTLMGLVLLLVPFLDRPDEDGELRPFWTYFTYGALVFIIVMTYIGYTVDPTA